MNYLLIENRGEIDINSLILMGGSTKRDDKKAIGFFGSGNKYAVALLMRNNIDFKIFSGETEMVFTTKSIALKDKQFDQIVINDKETSLTTDMGPKWTTWMAIREFVSNAIDEGGYNVVNSTTNLAPHKGYTRIYIEHALEVEDVIQNWDKYFAFERTDAVLETNGNIIYPQTNRDQSTILYRRGIRCHYSVTKSLFHYDLNDFEINESRIIESTHSAGVNVLKFLVDHASEQVAYTILSESHKSEYWEHMFSWWTYASRMNGNWRNAIGNRIIIVDEVSGWYNQEATTYPHFLVTTELAKLIRSSFPDVTIYGLKSDSGKAIFRKVEKDNKMEDMLRRAADFFTETKYLVNYPIEVVDFNSEIQLGGIDVGKILVSRKVFDKGMKTVVKVIMEENEHLKTQFKDCSREFQNHWINLCVTEMENRFGIFL